MNIIDFFRNFFLKHSFFIWILSVALVTLLSMAYLSTTISEAALKEEVKNNLATIANNKTSTIEQFIQTNKSDVSLLAKNPSLIAFMNQQDPASDTTQIAIIQSYLTRIQGQQHYKNIMLIKPDGKIVFSLKQPNAVGKNLEEYAPKASQLFPTFKNAITLIETQVSAFESVAPDRPPQSYIASPIFSAKALVGVLVVVMTNENITKVVSNTEGLGKTGETIVGKFKDNTIVPEVKLRHASISEFMKDASTITDPRMKRAFEQATQGSKGEGIMTDYLGHEVMGAWRYLPSLRWGVLVKADAEEVFAPISDLKKNIFLLSFFTFILIVFLAHLVGTRLQRAEDETAQLLYKLEVARDAALEANRTKSRFIANMSHELRTPLNAIIGYSEMLYEDAEDRGWNEILVDLSRITDAGQHLLGLINDILDLSKIESEKMEVYWEDVDIAGLVDNVQSIVFPLVKKSGNQLDIKLADDLGIWRTDSTKLRQCFLNLLSNANKFTTKGTVTLEIKRLQKDDGEWMQVSVEDTGIGMTPQQLENLFQAFIQADASTTREFGGTGLGLFITKNFCELMGGSIKVESQFKKGTTFTMLLPTVLNNAVLQKAPKAEPEAVSQKTSQQMPKEISQLKTLEASPEVLLSQVPEPILGPPRKILVIDKEKKTHDHFDQTLQEAGVEIFHAYTAEEGLALCKQHKPDMVILDAVVMPKIEGWNELAALKHDPEFKSTKVIMASMTEKEEELSPLGMTEFLSNPFQDSQLIEIIKRHVPYEKANILIVEDDDVTRKLIVRSLKKYVAGKNWHLREARNGQEAMEEVAKLVPTIILLDLMMPLMDGFMVVEKLRAQEAWSKIPVIIISAKDLTIEDRARLQGNGVKMLLSKGKYDHRELVNIISSQIEP